MGPGTCCGTPTSTQGKAFFVLALCTCLACCVFSHGSVSGCVHVCMLRWTNLCMLGVLSRTHQSSPGVCFKHRFPEGFRSLAIFLMMIKPQSNCEGVCVCVCVCMCTNNTMNASLLLALPTSLCAMTVGHSKLAQIKKKHNEYWPAVGFSQQSNCRTKLCLQM